MSISVHIERLVLDALPPGVDDTSRLAEAVQAELVRLLQDSGLRPDLAAGGNFAGIRGGELHGLASQPDAFAGQIAAAIHGGLAAPEGGPP